MSKPISMAFIMYPSNNSGYIRDLKDTPTAELRMELTDEDFETATVLRSFLAMLVHGKVSIDSKTVPHAVQCLKLIRLIQKFRCSVLKELFRNWLKVNGTQHALSSFVVAAHLGDNNWCGKIIETGGQPWHEVQAPEQYKPNGNRSLSVLDLRTAPAWLWKLLEEDYKYALCRAWFASPDESNGTQRARFFNQHIQYYWWGECRQSRIR